MYCGNNGCMICPFKYLVGIESHFKRQPDLVKQLFSKCLEHILLLGKYSSDFKPHAFNQIFLLNSCAGNL